jgi:tetratricopeptide (TPR) repeat protein
VDAWKNRGLARKMQDNYKGAFDDFNQAIRLNGRSPDLYNLRGSALLDKQAFNSAIADFGKAIALDSNYTKAYVNRGLALLYTRQLDRAIADFNVVVHLAPSDPRGYMDRAMARMEKGDFKGTIDDYNEAIRLDPNNSGPYTRRGEAWRLQGKLPQAVEDHNKAIALNPNDKEAYNNRALTFKDQGKLDEAIADCDQAILLYPGYDFAYATRGLIRRLKGDLWGSLTDLNKAVELNQSSPVDLTFRGDTLRESQNLNGAMEDFNKAILILPDCAAAYTGRGLTYEKMGNLAKAKADYEKALSLPADVDVGLAKPAQDVARTRLAALIAAEEAKRAKEAAERAAQEARAKEAAERATKEAIGRLAKVESAKLVPDDIQQLLYHRGHALLIGVSDYTTGWDKLPTVKDDLRRLEEALKPSFDTVETVLSPTVEQIRVKIREFFQGRWNSLDERLFIYYSGHGFTDTNRYSRKNNGYITGSDTPIYKAADRMAVANAVAFDEIVGWSGLTNARHVLMVFDSCFSGSLFTGKSAPPEAPQYEYDSVKKMLRYPIRYVITAGRQSETVAADGTFATALLNGLRGEADYSHNGVVSAVQLGVYLGLAVPGLSRGRQTPQFDRIESYQEEGQFFFLTKPAAADKSVDRAPTGTTPTGTTSGPLIESKVK